MVNMVNIDPVEFLQHEHSALFSRIEMSSAWETMFDRQQRQRLAGDEQWKVDDPWFVESADVRIKCHSNAGSGCVLVHSCFLASRTPKLANQLLLGELTEPGSRVLVVKCEEESLRILRRYWYTGNLRPTQSNCIGLLQAAKQIRIPGIPMFIRDSIVELAHDGLVWDYLTSIVTMGEPRVQSELFISITRCPRFYLLDRPSFREQNAQAWRHLLDHAGKLWVPLVARLCFEWAAQKCTEQGLRRSYHNLENLMGKVARKVIRHFRHDARRNTHTFIERVWNMMPEELIIRLEELATFHACAVASDLPDFRSALQVLRHDRLASFWATQPDVFYKNYTRCKSTHVCSPLLTPPGDDDKILLSVHFTAVKLHWLNRVNRVTIHCGDETYESVRVVSKSLHPRRAADGFHGRVLFNNFRLVVTSRDKLEITFHLRKPYTVCYSREHPWGTDMPFSKLKLLGICYKRLRNAPDPGSGF